MIAERPRHGYGDQGDRGALWRCLQPKPRRNLSDALLARRYGLCRDRARSPGRKLYRITSEGEAFLVANRTAADELLSRMAAAAERAEEPLPEMVADAIRTFKLALRLRLKRGSLDDEAAGKIAAALLQAAQTVEQS